MSTKNQTAVGDAIAAAVCATFFAFLLIVLALCFKRRHDRQALKHSINDSSSSGSYYYSYSSSFHAQSVAFSDVDVATAGFNSSLIVGTGDLGTVYRATSSTGEQLAVKRIDPSIVLAKPGLGFFASRVRTLSSLRHPNLVPVLGYAEAPGERVVITELVDGARSLEFYLHGRGRVLEWDLRVSVAAGVARALEHLHDSAAPGVVHGRVKPSNILIDAGFNARLCDYGLTFLAPCEKRGMVGYLDPESTKEINNGGGKAGDVYAFGVVLLELLSGRRSEGGKLAEWAVPMIRSGRVVEMVDARLRPPADIKPLLRLAKVASACVGNARSCRPLIDQLAVILSSLEMHQFLCARMED